MPSIYQNPDFYFFWKPHGLPSTFGKEKSLLDYIQQWDIESISGIDNTIKPYIDPSLKELKDTSQFLKNQTKTFTKTQEYWLLNRLDNDTAGFLYFAKELSIYDKYRQLQAQNKVDKHYIAQVFGNTTTQTIDYPIMHRSSKKMLAIKSNEDIKKGTGKQHIVQTFIQTLSYDKKSNISTLLVTIHKGIRHQIRVHLASIGLPIIGDILYGTKLPNPKNEHLCLWSIGCTIQK